LKGLALLLRREPEGDRSKSSAKNGALAPPPVRGMYHSTGNDGEKIEWRLQFREFCRLELNGLWHKISDYKLWRLHIKMRKHQGEWIDDGKLKDLTNDGW